MSKDPKKTIEVASKLAQVLTLKLNLLNKLKEIEKLDEKEKLDRLIVIMKQHDEELEILDKRLKTEGEINEELSR